jgi:hypothetical protein
MCSADEDFSGGQGPTSSSEGPPKEDCLGCGGPTPVDDLEDGLCFGCRSEPDLEDEAEDSEFEDVLDPEDSEFEDPEPFGRVVA